MRTDPPPVLTSAGGGQVSNAMTANPPDSLSPPRIAGEVPANYAGPLFYRTAYPTYDVPRYMYGAPVIFDDKALNERMGVASALDIAQRVTPKLFDGNGELLPDLRKPLPAKFRSTLPASRPEWHLAQTMHYVSERIREIVERHEPDINLFIPIDARGDDDAIERIYAFLPQSFHLAAPLALAANGVQVHRNEAGDPFGLLPPSVGQTDFLYLNSAALGRRKLYPTGDVGLVLHEDIVAELGDVLAKGEFFVPLGVVNEPYDTPRFREAAAWGRA